MPLVSIIVPVYNRETSILLCLRSLANMNCQDFEVLVVDDGSTDGSGQLSQEFCASDARFHYFYKGNGGVSSARNHALHKAQGRWVTFVDSDDAVTPEHLDGLLQPCVTEDVNFVVQLHQMVGTVTGEPKIESVADAYGIIQESDNPMNFMFTDFFPCRNPLFSTCGKFFKLATLREYSVLFCESLSLDEDQLFVSTYLQYATRMVFYPQARTYLFFDWGDVHMSGAVRKPQKFLEGYDANYDAFKKLYNKGGDAVKMYAIQYYIEGIIRRIVLNYTSPRLSRRLQKGELKQFVTNEIQPRFAKIDDVYISVQDKQIMRMFRMIKHGQIAQALIYGRCLNLAKSVAFKLKHLF